METKHTKSHAELLASKFAPINDMPQGTRMTSAYIQGYMKAIEENALPELLEAINELMSFHYYKHQNGVETYDANNKAHRLALVRCNEAIKKATE